MSEKIIVFSDLHIHNHQNDWRRVEDALAVLQWIRQEAIDRKIPRVLFLGDFFHVRGYMYPSIVAKAYIELLAFRDAGIEFTMLVGNHDMPYKNTTKHNCLTAFGSVCDVVEDVGKIEVGDWDIWMLPYIESPQKLNWAIDKVASGVSDRKNALFAHLDIKGAKFHANVESTHGIKAGEISDAFDIVISGHYHKRQEISDKIQYVGSPYQQNFGEAGDDKGFLIFDDGDVEFVENTFSPKYLYLKSSEVNDNIEGNYVTISVEDSNNLIQVRENAAQFSPRHVIVKIDRTDLEENRQLVSMKTDAKDVSALMKEWVQKTANPKIYDIESLISYGVGLVRETGEQ